MVQWHFARSRAWRGRGAALRYVTLRQVLVASGTCSTRYPYPYRMQRPLDTRYRVPRPRVGEVNYIWAPCSLPFVQKWYLVTRSGCKLISPITHAAASTAMIFKQYIQQISHTTAKVAMTTTHTTFSSEARTILFTIAIHSHSSGNNVLV